MSSKEIDFSECVEFLRTDTFKRAIRDHLFYPQVALFIEKTIGFTDDFLDAVFETMVNHAHFAFSSYLPPIKEEKITLYFPYSKVRNVLTCFRLCEMQGCFVSICPYYACLSNESNERPFYLFTARKLSEIMSTKIATRSGILYLVFDVDCDTKRQLCEKIGEYFFAKFPGLKKVIDKWHGGWKFGLIQETSEPISVENSFYLSQYNLKVPISKDVIYHEDYKARIEFNLLDLFSKNGEEVYEKNLWRLLSCHDCYGDMGLHCSREGKSLFDYIWESDEKRLLMNVINSIPNVFTGDEEAYLLGKSQNEKKGCVVK